MSYVVCFVSVYTISCCLQCRDGFGHLCLCTYYIIFLLPLFTTKSDRFFLLPHFKRLGVGES